MRDMWYIGIRIGDTDFVLRKQYLCFEEAKLDAVNLSTIVDRASVFKLERSYRR